MSNKRVSLFSRKAAPRLMNYSAVRHMVESKLPSSLLDEWKELIFVDFRSKKMWGQDQSHGFHWHIYKDLTGFKYQKILNFVNTKIKIQLKSFFYNTKMIYKILIGWAKQQIVNEGKDS
jgi:hypothetical protein